MKAQIFCLVSLLLLLESGCDSRPPATPRETVMEPGMVITATNKNGTVTVTCLGPAKRKYEADGNVAVRDLTPRPDRFEYEGQIGQGILGLYDPATTLWPSLRPRWVLQEAERHFRSQEEAMRFLVMSRDFLDWVYTPDGLVIGFGRDPRRGNQYNVEVYQFYVGGKKPQGLSGARPEKLHISKETGRK
jgi:hypothetical protein